MHVGRAFCCVQSLRPRRCRNAQHDAAGIVSSDSKLHLPLRANAIILAIKAAASPVGVRQHKLPP
jgi:hypothetical protein